MKKKKNVQVIIKNSNAILNDEIYELVSTERSDTYANSLGIYNDLSVSFSTPLPIVIEYMSSKKIFFPFIIAFHSMKQKKLFRTKKLVLFEPAFEYHEIYNTGKVKIPLVYNVLQQLSESYKLKYKAAVGNESWDFECRRKCISYGISYFNKLFL